MKEIRYVAILISMGRGENNASHYNSPHVPVKALSGEGEIRHAGVSAK